MIYTCTLNPSLDYFIQIDQFQPGELNRMASEKKMPGGKGINVSRVLKRLQTDSLATGFLGGFTGDFIKKKLSEENIETSFIPVEGDTRINVKLKSDDETEINGLSPVISSSQLQELIKKAEKLGSEDILVLSGSLPGSVDHSFYKEMIEHVRGREVKVVVDTSGEALKEAIKANPFLVKPNQHELSQLFNAKVDTPAKAVHFAKELVNSGISNVIVSMGADGALLVTADSVYYADVPEGELKNSVGAGDSLVAGFLANFIKSNDIKKAFQYGAASGSATAFSVDLCTKESVEKILPAVKITKWEEDGDLS